jgi:hypothetical protein
MDSEHATVKIGRTAFGAFSWYVPDAGYRWTDAPPGQAFVPGSEPPFLIANAGPLHHTNPLGRDRQRGLHREFAGLSRHLEDLPGFKAAVRAFASEHGKLGLPGAAWFEETTMMVGEPLAQWQAEVRRFARLVAMWDAAAGGDEAACRRLVKFDQHASARLLTLTFPGGSGSRRHVETLDLADGAFDEQQLVGLWKRRAGPDYPAMLRYACHVLVNQRLKDHVRLEALPFLKQFYITPDSLLAALYLLLAREMLGDHWSADQQGICKGCGALFTGDNRSDRQFCSYQCRKRYWWRMNRGSDAKAKKASRKAGDHGNATRAR